MLPEGVTGSLRRVAGHVARSPGWQLVIAGLLLAVLFPARATGAIGMTIVAAGLGVAAALSWPRLPPWLRRPPADVTSALVICVVVVSGVSTFWEALMQPPDWPMGDWGPQHAVLADAMSSMPGLDLPVWNHRLSTGDAPFELYPSLTYLIAGHLAHALGLEHDVPHALMIVAVIAHLTIAAMTAAIAMRIAPKPLALIVALIALVDSGAIAHGGTVGLFRWALLHSAVALAFSLVAAFAVVAALRRPRLATSITIWLATALATAAHPAGLLSAAVALLGLGAAALLARDVPPRRALVAMIHVVLGVALGAVVWMPLADRVLLYGQHFPNAVRSPQQVLEDVLRSPSPVTHYAFVVYAGYLGLIAGLWSRRAAVVFVSSVALALLVGLCDLPYLAFDLAPGYGVARLGTERLAQLARPFVMASAAFGLALFVRAALDGWRTATHRQRLVAAGVLGVLASALLRVVPGVWADASYRAAADAHTYAPDPDGRRLLREWAQAQVRTLGPSSWGRALFEQDTHEQMHLTAETGLPTLHDLWIPDLLLRERIEDTTDASLARFNIRWIVGVGRSPSRGDPATEVHLGSYAIRELSTWDGKFARIERGTGDVVVHRLDDRAVEIEVTGTTAPVLVALGTGYYPRWRATHASGSAQPVYAYPATPSGRLHVVSAWVAPGRTRFTVDGPLPSDGKGRLVSLSALLLVIAAIVIWRVGRWRRRTLRVFARTKQRATARVGGVLRVGVPIVIVILLARGCIDDSGITPAIELGTGVRATATVDARLPGGDWQRCDYRRLQGIHACDGVLTATDHMAALINDASPSWPFNTPGIAVRADVPAAEVRIRRTARLSGRYWIATSGAPVTIEIEGEDQHVTARGVLSYADRGTRTVELRAAVSAEPWQLSFVHEASLLPPRGFLTGPPDAPPPDLRNSRNK